MPYNFNPITVSQFVATIDGFPNHYFTEVSDLTQNRQVIEVYDGYSEYPKQILGNAESGTITLRKPYDPVADAPLIEFIQNYSHSDKPVQVTVTPTRPGKNREGTGVEITAYECLPVGISYPGFNASGVGDVAMLEVRMTRRMILAS